MLSWHRCGFVLATVVFLISPARISAYKCAKLREKRCRYLGYNRTIEPNMFGHRGQGVASSFLNQFIPLINVDCFPYMTAFLCSVYFPVCTDWKENAKPIPPCRSFCLDAKTGCEGIMNKFGYKWPNDLNCTRFPLYSTNELCIYKNKTATSQTARPATVTRPRKPKPRLPNMPLKHLRKICWDSSNSTTQATRENWNKPCCRQGNRMAKRRSETCSKYTPKPIAKHWLRKKKKSIRKTNKMCSKGMGKACYKACCEYKKKQNKNKNKGRKSRKRRP